MSRATAGTNRIVRTLQRTSRQWNPTAVSAVAQDSRDPFRILISCLISLRTKARTIKRLCRTLAEQHGSRVPADLETLLTLKGVGRKTANLVITVGYGKPGICVDTHVHRISNRLGIVKTKIPEQTEFALRQVLPRRHWIPYNDLLVTFGQNVCKPISPLCSTCPVNDLCPRIGVVRHR